MRNGNFIRYLSPDLAICAARSRSETRTSMSSISIALAA
jgi:hypothetical protein